MAKLKKPEDFGVKVPKTKVLQADDGMADEDDDEMYEALSDEGLAPAADDLTVQDFFAGLIAAHAGPPSDAAEDDLLARRSYDVAAALCRERARRNELEGDDAA